MAIPKINGHMDGYHHGDASIVTSESITNGHRTQLENYTESRASRTETRTLVESSHTNTFTSTQQVTVLRQTVLITRSKLLELSHVDDQYIDLMRIESFVDYIECERLTYMPDQGSRWDRVLKWAEYFAGQISGYEIAISPFVPDSKIAAKLIWAACRALIEVNRKRLISFS